MDRQSAIICVLFLATAIIVASMMVAVVIEQPRVVVYKVTTWNYLSTPYLANPHNLESEPQKLTIIDINSPTAK